jgi:hypothetical protein
MFRLAVPRRARCLGVLTGILTMLSALPSRSAELADPATCQNTASQPNFLVMGGGGAPSYNEIALEKNVLYFQRTLQALGLDLAAVSTFFANGTDGQPTVRYLEGRKELFKVPEIPQLAGASTLSNFQNWIQQTVEAGDRRPVFFYFTGHGYRNPRDVNNNAMILWGEELLSVRELANSLDQLPQTTPVVTMMSQCYAGAFANFIYEDGDPRQSVALQTRCGFFATIKTRPSVGCTPEVNEADYRDYSSSFFAGLSGRDRTGRTMPSADYNRDSKVSYAEAHAFAKVDEQSTDLPVSTLEVWLQEKSGVSQAQILSQPIIQILVSARPEQKHVVDSLVQQFGFNANGSFVENTKRVDLRALSQEQQAYLSRLGMELFNIGAEQQVRAQSDRSKIAIVERLITCEGGSWRGE